MDKPIISVIMPVYNTKKVFLKQAIESILNQTLGDFELLIVNDGSTNPEVDETIKSYQDKRIKYYVIENSGAAAARNYGLDRATGEYIAIMDSDDIALPERFEKEVTFLEKNPDVSVCGADMDLLNEEGVKIDQTDVISCPRVLDVLENTPVAHSTTMWRRNDLEKLHLRYNPDFKVTNDYEFFSRVIRTFKISNIKEVLVQYHVQSNSLFHSNSELAQINIQKIRNSLLDFLSIDELMQTKISQLVFANGKFSQHKFLFPRWLGKIICCFIPSKKNRKHFRQKHIKPKKG